MKTRILAIAALLLAFGTSAKAQDKKTTLTFGYSPLGSIETRIKLDDEKYKYNYKSFFNANFGFEKQFEGAVTLSEFTYSQAAFDKYDLKGTSQWFNPNQQEDIYAVSFTQYIGTTINAKGAVQLPLYIGIGADYLNGGPFHNLDIAGAVRAKLKVFITGHLGIYVGAGFRYGLGMKSASESSSSNKTSYTVYDMMWNVDGGIMIGL